MILAKIAIVMFGVANLGSSVSFYQEKLGWKLTSRSEDFAFFTDGTVTVGLSVPLGKAVKPLAGATELVITVDSVTAATAEFEKKGCRFEIAPRAIAGEQWASTFLDPDGHRITLFGPK